MKRAVNLPSRQAGFSLLEVLIALLILGFGLLGFALLQTMNVRFVQSSGYRTQATNLAYDLTEQMRANRKVATWYNAASFSPGSLTPQAKCDRTLGALTIQQNITRWQCQVVKALGAGAGATVTVSNTGVVNVGITWADQRWNADKPADTTTFALQTQL